MNELVALLGPYAFVSAVPIITFITRYLKKIKDLGKFNFIWPVVLSAVFSVGQKFVMDTPLQTDWWNIVLMFGGTALASVGLHSLSKNAKQGAGF